MCRLYALRASEPLKVECALVHAQNALLTQSRRDSRGETHADGWGIAHYLHERPTVEKRAVAAFGDVSFSDTAARVRARTVVAHVRQATVGGPSLPNTHPFVHGPWTFAHNGGIRDFARLGASLESEVAAQLLGWRRGTTDSELAFYWLLTRMAGAGLENEAPCADLDALVRVVGQGIRELNERADGTPHGGPDAGEPSRLNFVLTDGTVLVASRWGHTLYWTERDAPHICEVCGLAHVDRPVPPGYRAVIIASEPLSSERWSEVPDRSVISVDASMRVRITES